MYLLEKPEQKRCTNIAWVKEIFDLNVMVFKSFSLSDLQMTLLDLFISDVSQQTCF